MEDEFPPLPLDAPDRLKETWEAAKHFAALGSEGRVVARQRWSPELKRRCWAELITREGSALDATPEDHPWHDPTSDRLRIVVERLAARLYEQAFLEEMVSLLRAAAREDPTGMLAARLLGRRWQHWARFLKRRPSPSELRWPPHPGKFVAHGEFLALLRSCLREGGARAIRDAAMFVCIHGAAASTDELGFLSLSDWTPEPPALRLKSGRDPFRHRTVALGYEAANLLAGWVALRGRRPGRMFYSLDKFGAIRSERITGAAIHAALKQRCKQAGLSLISPEELRRAGMRRLFEHGADLYAVADIGGHASLAETEAYELPPSVARVPLALHGETPFHRW